MIVCALVGFLALVALTLREQSRSDRENDAMARFYRMEYQPMYPRSN